MTDTMSDILDERCIELDIGGRRKDEIIAELAGTLARGVPVADLELLVSQLIEREKLSTTGIGDGIAIPHALTGTVESTAMAFGRKRRGVKFDAVDNRPVSLFFLLVGPEGSHNEHLRLLSRLSRYLHNPDFRRALMHAQSPEDVLEAFRIREGRAEGRG